MTQLPPPSTDQLDLNDIRIFVVAAQEGTLSAAAHQLHVTASTIGRALTRLEKHLGILLVRRSSRGLVLTDTGKEYLLPCRRALRLLAEGTDLLSQQRSSPSGVLKVACPITMARSIFAPLLKEFLDRYPALRVEIQPYASNWQQEPRDDIDVFFKVRAPKDSLRRVRSYPGIAQGLFASPAYLEKSGHPAHPDELAMHRCVGGWIWKLKRGREVLTPAIAFAVVTDDPEIHLQLAKDGAGIAMLPLWMAKWPEVRNALVPVLPAWKPPSVMVCALFSGSAKLTPKVQVMLDFLAEYLGTDRDPRLRGAKAKGYFTGVNLPPNEALD